MLEAAWRMHDTKVHSNQSMLLQRALSGGADTERFTITDRR